MSGLGRITGVPRLLNRVGYALPLIILSIPIISPLFRWGTNPCTHDGHLHYHRLAAMRHAWENGLAFSRWLPDVAFGYGYPFFLYREALPLYLSLGPHLLGLPLTAAINLFYSLTAVVAGYFMFLWVRDLLGALPALIAGLAYMASPYLLTDALIRGNQPESLALALLPLACWAGRRHMIRPTTGSFLIAVVSLALLALSHNISILLFTPFYLIYLAFVGWLDHLTWPTIAVRFTLIVGLGLGLAAFYLAPALLELDEITINQSINARNNDFRFNFVTVDELMARPQAADPTLLNAPLPFRLGWAPVGLSLLGLLAFGRFSSREVRGHILFMGLAVLIYLFMASTLSQPLWERLPLIRYVQFPWRLVGRAALPLAFLAGVPVAVLVQFSRGHRSHTFSIAGATLAVIVLMVEAWPSLYPHYCQEPGYPTINTVHAYERNTGMVGVDPRGSYFPVSVANRPVGSALETDYRAGRPPQRFDVSSLPPGAEVLKASYRPISARVSVSSPLPFRARYLTFSFPGWTAKVDGKPVPITPSRPEGLITFPVPAGLHEIEIEWDSTSLRNVSGAVSIFALFLTMFTAVIINRGGDSGGQVTSSGGSASHLDRRVPGYLIILATALLLAKTLVVDRMETPFRRPAPPPVDMPVDLSGAGLKLAGYNLAENRVAAGDVFVIDLAWQVVETPAADYQTAVSLVGSDGLSWSAKETYRPRLYEDTAPTIFWGSGQWAWESWEVQVLPGTPPGSYDLRLTLFDLANLQPVTLIGPGGQTLGPAANIGQIEVTTPSSPAEIEPQHVSSEEIAGLILLGYSQDRVEVAPGDLILLTWFWERKDWDIVPPERLALSLVDGEGQDVQRWSLPPVKEAYPPSIWEAEERLRGQHALRLAAVLESGVYQFELEGVRLGSISLEAPDRLFEPPDFSFTLGANFGDMAELAGYSLGQSGERDLVITLTWLGLTQMDTSFRVFVHLVDRDGQIVVQSDTEPADWARPTTGWSPGEYIIDVHRLTLPAKYTDDELTLLVGLYDPLTGNRIPINSDDAVTIPLADMER